MEVLFFLPELAAAIHAAVKTSVFLPASAGHFIHELHEIAFRGGPARSAQTNCVRSP